MPAILASAAAPLTALTMVYVTSIDVCDGGDDMADADEDGVPDDCDNCEGDGNPGQEGVDTAAAAPTIAPS